MTPFSLRADLVRLQQQLSRLVNRANREPWAVNLAGTELGDALDAAAKARDHLAAALDGSRR